MDDRVARDTKLRLQLNLRTRRHRYGVVAVAETRSEHYEIDHPHRRSRHENEQQRHHGNDAHNISHGEGAFRAAALGYHLAERRTEDQAQQSEKHRGEGTGKSRADCSDDRIVRQLHHGEARNEERDGHSAKVVQQVDRRKNQRIPILHGA